MNDEERDDRREAAQIERDRDGTLGHLRGDTRERFAQIAQRAAQDIDEGAIKLTGEDADHELARKAEQKHAATDWEAKCLECGHLRASHGAGPGARCLGACECPGFTRSAERRAAKDRQLELEHASDIARRALEVQPGGTVQIGRAVLADLLAGLEGRPPSLEDLEDLRLELERQQLVIVPAVPTEKEKEALAFCFRIALEHDHGGAKRLRRLLYAWHNALELGGFDFTDLWSLDATYLGHALTVINMIARSPQGWYADHYGYGADMEAIVETYGPHR